MRPMLSQPRKETGRARIGNYVVLGRWASGGMAHVYVARKEADFDRNLYAIKALREEFLGDEQFCDMFRTEAHVAGLWSHPNAVKPQEIISENGRLYIVME